MKYPSFLVISFLIISSTVCAQSEITSGCISGDCKKGFGTWLFDNGEKYIGRFKKNQPHGYGEWHYLNGDVYHGDFEKGERIDGQGSMYYANGDTYTGAWINNKREGFGRLDGNDGKIKKYGEWKNDILVEDFISEIPEENRWKPPIEEQRAQTTEEPSSSDLFDASAMQNALFSDESKARLLYISNFEDAFRKVIENASNNFAAIISQTDFVEIKELSKIVKYNKALVEFPEAIRAHYEVSDINNDKWDTRYSIIILYNTDAYDDDDWSNDSELQAKTYNKVIRELQRCTKNNIGGTWTVEDYGFTTFVNQDESLQVQIEPMILTGVSIQFTQYR